MSDKKKTVKAEPKAETKPEVLSAVLQAAFQQYADSYRRELATGASERPIQFDAMLAAYQDRPTLTNSEASTLLVSRYLKDVPVEFGARPVSGAWEKGLLICRKTDESKLDKGWDSVKAILTAHGWNATVKEIVKSKAMPEPEKRNRNARPPKGKNAASHGDVIVKSDADNAVKQCGEYLTKFYSLHFGNGRESVVAHPVQALNWANTITNLLESTKMQVEFVRSTLANYKPESKKEAA